MAASIVLTGLANNDPTPGVYLQVDFAQGPAGGFGGQRAILVLANKSAAGTATPNTTIYGPDTQIPLQTEADMINFGGAGSEAHRMFRRIVAINGSTPVYWVFVAASTGAAAAGTITITGTATANATQRTWVHDESIDTAITSGDTPTVIATNIAASINTKTTWGVTASSNAGVVTLTAKVPGLRGNWIRYQAAIFSTLTVTTTTSATADAYLTGGTTADSNTMALGTILPWRYYYIVSAAEDATQLGALAGQVLTQALPTVGIRQKIFGGSIDTLANVQTICTGINSPRAEVTWLQESTWTPAELAANAAALYALLENSGSRPRNNYSMFPAQAPDQALWKVPAPRDNTVAPTRNNLKSAILNGVTPINVLPGGATQLTKRVTTRSLQGTVQDSRVRDACKVTIPDFFADDLGTKVALEFGGKDLADDPPKGAQIPGPQVVTPRLLAGAIKKLVSEYGQNTLLVNTDQIKAAMLVQRETGNRNRMSASIPLQVVDIADQFALEVAQVS